jgi:hypothetical protein
MSFFGRQTGVSDRRGTRKIINRDDRLRLKEYMGDTDPDDMAELFIENLLKKHDTILPIDYRFVVEMTILLYYDEDFLIKIKDTTTRYEMSQLRLKVNKSFQEKINIMIDKFNEELSNNDILQEYEDYLTKDNLLSLLIDNVNQLLIITSKAKVATNFTIKNNLTLYSGLGYLQDCDRLMLENLLYLNNIGEREWITPTFISTTHSRDTSIRFAGKIKKNSDSLVILRITVTEDRLKYFPYNPMYDNVIQLPMSKKDTTRESEVLLPPYIKLAYMGETEENIKYLVPHVDGKTQIEKISKVVFLDLMFIDYADKFALEDKDIDERKIILGESKYKDPLTIVSELKDLFIKKRGGRKIRKKSKKIRKKSKKIRKKSKKIRKKSKKIRK